MTQTPPPSAVGSQVSPAAQPPYAQGAFAPGPFTQGPVPAAEKLSAAAVCALVASALALVPVGVVLGIVALFRTQRLRQRGKKLAVIALSLCAVWSAVGMGAIIASAAVVASQEGSIDAFGSGTCFLYHDGTDPTQGIDVVGCGQLHDGEIVARHSLGGAYPGEDAAARQSVVGCVDDSARAMPDAGRPNPDTAEFRVYYPSQDSWDAGMHSATCILGRADHTQVTTDVMDASGLTPLQRQVLRQTNETVLLRLKLHDLPASGWKIAVALEQRLAEADHNESGALTALAADPPAGATADLPRALRGLAAADLAEASQADTTATAVTSADGWQDRIDADTETASQPPSAYGSLRIALGLPEQGA